mgnify:CR=1 FL=1
MAYDAYDMCEGLWCLCFFFQAEDDIRDLVRSRGLGDVYKRQGLGAAWRQDDLAACTSAGGARLSAGRDAAGDLWPVSYTHLTLPTSDLV